MGKGQLGLESIPDEIGTRETDSLLWGLYQLELEGETLDLALAESDGDSYFVILSATGDLRETYYRSVFLAAVDALKPK